VRMVTAPGRVLKGFCVVLWVAAVLVPLMSLAVEAVKYGPEQTLPGDVSGPVLRSVALAGLIAATAVVLGWLPGRLLGVATKGAGILFFGLLLPLVLPRYVLYYAWTVLLSPTTSLGSYIAARPELARTVGTVSCSAVLMLWYWPLAALILAQGWRSLEGGIWDCAVLDASRWQRFRYVVLPLLARPAAMAFLVCFVLSLSEFGTFHLAGVRTIGTELAVLYQRTGSEVCVARAAWPAVLAAVAVGLLVGGRWGFWQGAFRGPVRAVGLRQRTAVVVSAALVVLSVIVPVGILLYNVEGTTELRRFITLHLDGLGWSGLVAVVGAVGAYALAWAGLSQRRGGRRAERRGGWRGGRLVEVLPAVVRVTLFTAMFLPASVVGISVLRLWSRLGLDSVGPAAWPVVSVGQAVRFAGAGLLLLELTYYPDRRRLSEMAAVDGASGWKAWRYVHLPQVWPAFVGGLLLLTMFGLTELSATMVLLPPGLPNFAQRLLNQMHYARDQQVIASCLVLVGLFVIAGGVSVVALCVGRRRGALLVLCAAAVCFVGCRGSGAAGEPKVVWVFGRTGRGGGEFVYPRAIDIAPDGSLYIVDKTGRIQQLTARGKFLNVIQMPEMEAGKPTGLSFGPDGLLYVADTHYHRVMVFGRDGEVVRQFGRFGQGEGCFIYPTDVAFSPDGKIFVSEYGGNDRISVYDRRGRFLFSFGTPGSGREQLSRPSALCVDEKRGRLYVADACNHRIAIYRLDGTLCGYIGSAGRERGQLRYPYDLALLADGTVVVCEYGNNRIQLFSAAGESLAVYGRAGRGIGQLAYPWGIAVDKKRRAYVVDAGNDRIQIWQL